MKREIGTEGERAREGERKRDGEEGEERWERGGREMGEKERGREMGKMERGREREGEGEREIERSGAL